MHIILGSISKRKINLVKKVVKELLASDITLEGKDVSSGVSETPHDQETKEGARNRAKQVKILSKDYDYLIGLESGLVKRYGDLYEEAWACVITKEGKEYFGYSSGLRVPDSIVSEMRKGIPHARLMEQFDEKLEVENKDTWASYSGRMISRDVSLEESLRNAFIQILAGEKSFYKMGSI